VEVLFEVIGNGDEHMKEAALGWLIRLAEEPDGRKRVSQTGIGIILDTMTTYPTSSTIWLTAASLMMTLCTYADTASTVIVTTPKVFEYLGTLLHQQVLNLQVHPIAVLMTAKIMNILLETDEGRTVISDQKISPEYLDSMLSPTGKVAIDAAISSILPKDLVHDGVLGGQDSLLLISRALGFSVLAAGWGRVRWTLHAVAHGIPPSHLWRFVAKQSKTGRSLFVLLTMDLIAQAVMSWPKSGFSFYIPFLDKVELPGIPETIMDQPLTTVVPITEAGLFIATGLLLFRYQRYLVFPLVLASATTHWDALKGYVEPAYNEAQRVLK